ncbi:hypothetical protein EOS_35980 [Caballeronia mineralivorans PML1(12)]|uniref:Uncharacterized protein n=1 Tax=Caballeronia mineralivorans PML1(12) TaxID=908627 RepID=A0A0J1FNW9_9BURK|nr:hypothetical protein EOS_35980 [Caballeronia mineralivorans PML1(12)]
MEKSIRSDIKTITRHSPDLPCFRPQSGIGRQVARTRVQGTHAAFTRGLNMDASIPPGTVE